MRGRRKRNEELDHIVDATCFISVHAEAPVPIRRHGRQSRRARQLRIYLPTYLLCLLLSVRHV